VCSSDLMRIFVHPSGYRDRDPRIVVRNGRVWAVWTRVQPIEGCGDGSQPVGVYFRSRTLPDGKWSAEARLGVAGHELESVDVGDGDTLYAVTRDNGNGAVYVEWLTPSDFSRYPLSSKATGGATVRVDHLGRPWIAYETANGVRIARFTGHNLTSVSIGAAPGSSTFAPDILFDSANHAYVTWIREPDQGGGCVTRDVEPADGIYFATNASGAWKTQRITHRLGEYSAALDGSGRLRLVLHGWDDTLRYIAQTPSGTFKTTILSTRPLTSPQIVIDPATGAAVVTYIPVRGESTKSLVITTHG